MSSVNMKNDKYFMTTIPNIIVKSDSGEYAIDRLIKVIHESKFVDKYGFSELLILEDAFLITDKLKKVLTGNNLKAELSYYIFYPNKKYKETKKSANRQFEIYQISYNETVWWNRRIYDLCISK